MTTFIMLPGAMHGAWSWSRVASRLAADGIRTIAPELPGIGGNHSIAAGDATLDLWTDYVVDQIREAGEPVYLVAHSRGGLVIGEAAERVPELVLGLIYVTALVVPPGKTVIDVMGPETAAHSPPLCEEGKAMYMTPEQAKPLFYNRCDPADADWASARLCPEPLVMGDTPSRVTWERWGSLPRAFVECLDDHTLTIERQRTIQAAAPCDPVIAIDADHSPFLSAPVELVHTLIAIVDDWSARQENAKLSSVQNK